MIFAVMYFRFCGCRGLCCYVVRHVCVCVSLAFISNKCTHCNRFQLHFWYSYAAVIINIISNMRSMNCRCAGRYVGHSLGNQYGASAQAYIWLDNLECVGNEPTLGSCPHNGWNSHNCGHGEDVSISCHWISAVSKLAHLCRRFVSQQLLPFCLTIPYCHGRSDGVGISVYIHVHPKSVYLTNFY